MKKLIFISTIVSLCLLKAQGFQFAVSLTASAGDQGGGYEMTVGFSEDATDGYDNEFDVYAPPAPPPPAFDAALTWEGDRYYTQIVAGLDGDVGIEHEWEVRLAYPSDNLITLTWDNTGWSDLMTSCLLQDAFGGAMINVDMNFQNSLELNNPALNTLKLKVTPSIP